MASHALGAFVRIEGEDTEKKTVGLGSPTPKELDDMIIGPLSPAHYTGPPSDQSRISEEQGNDGPTKTAKNAASGAPANVQDVTLEDLESSRPSSPVGAAASVVQTWNNPSINKWRLLVACLELFGNGANDAAPGALLPYIQSYYHINYSIVATIFLCNAGGFISAAFFVSYLDSKIGRAKTLMFSEVLSVIAYVIAVITPPFPLFAITFFIAGFGQATGLALNNVFAANLWPSTTILGTIHASYGLGGTISPIVATALVTRGVLFSRFYAILLVLRFLNIGAAGTAFRGFSSQQQAADPSIELIPSEHGQESVNTTQQPGTQEQPPPRAPRTPRVSAKNPKSNFSSALLNRITPIGGLFIFAYQGAEVAIAGWAVTFLITNRGGDPSRVGYVTSGFWGGIALGRLLLSPLASRFGERYFCFALVVGATAFQILVWKLQSVIGDAVFIAILGLLLGPLWPCAARVFSQHLPRQVQNTALAFISSAGSSGGAIAPFITGVLSQSQGVWVLHPVAIAAYVVMMACWISLPRLKKREE